MAKKAKAKAATIPAMDYPEHERTYDNFVALFKWGTIVLVVLMAFLALFFA